MTPRERYKRIDGYSRASKRAHGAFTNLLNMGSVFAGDLYKRALDLARARESFAWSRLPDNLRKSLQP